MRLLRAAGHTLLHLLCGARRLGAHHAQEAVTLCTEQGFPYYLAAGAVLSGAALPEQKRQAAGSEQIRQGILAYRATGAGLLCPLWLTFLAETCGEAGQVEAGLAAVTEALTLAGQTSEALCEAELYRLKGELLLQQAPDRQSEPEACFHNALTVASHQQAKSWELRAATSLARLWQQQGKTAEARDLLTPIYDWFTEGFDTADLKDAKGLLDELA